MLKALSPNPANNTTTPQPSKEGLTMLQPTSQPMRSSPHTTLNWGLLPLLSVVAALGLLLVAVADTAARINDPWAETIFWIGVLVMYVPIAARLLSGYATRREIVGLIMFLGPCLYLVKVLHSPIGFTFSDEFAHWRTANDIYKNGTLFARNPLLSVTSLYPGLGLATTALVHISGLSIFHAALILLGVAKGIWGASLYLIYEQVSLSNRIASIATLVYMTNANFVFFTSQFGYESLSLPLMMLAVAALILQEREKRNLNLVLNLIAALAVTGVVATHHLTAYFLVGFLIVWTIVAYVLGRRGTKQISALWIALLLTVEIFLWVNQIAGDTAGYLQGPIQVALDSITRTVTTGQSDRELFRSVTGESAPILERLTGIATAGIVSLLLPIGLWLLWHKYRRNAFALTLGGLASFYPVAILLRLTGGSWEIGNRSSEFISIGVGFVLALVLSPVGSVLRDLEESLSAPFLKRMPFFRGRRFEQWVMTLRVWLQRFPWLQSFRLLAFTMAVAIIAAGGIIAGWSPYARLPWPYVLISMGRSIEPQGVSAALWVRDFLGPNNAVTADMVNRWLLASYGEQHTVDSDYGYSTSGLFLTTRLGSDEFAILRRTKVRYVVIDRRISSGNTPLLGRYFDGWEHSVFRYSQNVPISVTQLEKFDSMKNVHRVFDSEDISVYDIGALQDGK
jgi:hypothetical protein